jgi:hypothetical protein
MAILGIDIGGSGVKGALVDTARGELVQERYRVPTPQPSDVGSVVGAVAQVAEKFDGYDRVGVTFPGVGVDEQELLFDAIGGRFGSVDPAHRIVHNGPDQGVTPTVARGEVRGSKKTLPRCPRCQTSVVESTSRLR